MDNTYITALKLIIAGLLIFFAGVLTQKLAHKCPVIGNYKVDSTSYSHGITKSDTTHNSVTAHFNVKVKTVVATGDTLSPTDTTHYGDLYGGNLTPNAKITIDSTVTLNKDGVIFSITLKSDDILARGIEITANVLNTLVSQIRVDTVHVYHTREIELDPTFFQGNFWSGGVVGVLAVILIRFLTK